MQTLYASTQKPARTARDLYLYLQKQKRKRKKEKKAKQTP